MEVSLNLPICKSLAEFINKDLKGYPCFEAHKTVLKHHTENTYFCIYVTKAVWYKCRLYKASEVNRIRDYQR